MKFAVKPFVTTILLFVVLNTVWTYFSVLTDRFTERDKGLVTGLGYLVIFASAIYFGRKPAFWGKWFVLVFCMIALFLLSTFILGPLMQLAGYYVGDWFEMMYFVVNSIWVAWALTALLNRFYGMANPKKTTIITSVCMMGAYVVTYLETKHYIYLPDYLSDIHGMFNIFHLFLIVPLAAGLSVRKDAASAVA